MFGCVPWSLWHPAYFFSSCHRHLHPWYLLPGPPEAGVRCTSQTGQAGPGCRAACPAPAWLSPFYALRVSAVPPCVPSEKFFVPLSPSKTTCYDARHFLRAMRVPTTATWGNIPVMDLQRLHEEAYRWEIVVTLMRDHGDALTRYCRT